MSNENETVVCAITGNEVPAKHSFTITKDENQVVVSYAAVVELAVQDAVWPAVASKRTTLENLAKGRVEGVKVAVDEMSKLAQELGEEASFKQVQEAFIAKLQESQVEPA